MEDFFEALTSSNTNENIIDNVLIGSEDIDINLIGSSVYEKPKQDNISLGTIIEDEDFYNIIDDKLSTEEENNLARSHNIVTKKAKGSRASFRPDFSITREQDFTLKYLEQVPYDHYVFDQFNDWWNVISNDNLTYRHAKLADGRYISFSDLHRHPPVYQVNGTIHQLTPAIARTNRLTYGSEWVATINIYTPQSDGSYDQEKFTDKLIGVIPIMKGSDACITKNMTHKQLIAIGEDPYESGGYFIVGGVEKMISHQEKLAVDRMLIIQMRSGEEPIIRMTISTQRGTIIIQMGVITESDKKTKIKGYDKKPIIAKRIDYFITSLRNSKDGYHSYNVLRIYLYLQVQSLEEIYERLRLFIRPEHYTACINALVNNVVDIERHPDHLRAFISLLSPGNRDQKTNADRYDSLSVEDIERFRSEAESKMYKFFFEDLFPQVTDTTISDNMTSEEILIERKEFKLNMLSIMLGRYLEFVVGARAVDKRDEWSNKRLEGPGRIMEQLFRNSFRNMIQLAIQQLRKIQGTSIVGNSSIINMFKDAIITNAFYQSFVTSLWGVKGLPMKTNTNRPLDVDNIAAGAFHRTLLDVEVSRNAGTTIRAVQNSQLGIICFVFSTENKNIGLSKSIAITTTLSPIINDSHILNLIMYPHPIITSIHSNYISFSKRILSTLHDNTHATTLVIMNGKFIGYTVGSVLKRFLINLRRTGNIDMHTTIILASDGVLYIDSTPARPMIPTLLVDAKTNELLIDVKGLRDAPVDDLIRAGVLEYLSTWELEYTIAALSYKDILDYGTQLVEEKNLQQLLLIELNNANTTNNRRTEVNKQLEAYKNKKQRNRYSHCLLDGSVILGVATSLILLPNHNQAPRNSYQANMLKQALSHFGMMIPSRLNSNKMRMLLFANRPIMSSIYSYVIGTEIYPFTQMANVAFIAAPYTEEDGLIMMKEAQECGFGRSIRRSCYREKCKNDGSTDILTKPELTQYEDNKIYHGIGSNGLPYIGIYLTQGDCVIGRQQNVEVSKGIFEKRNASIFMKIGDEGIVSDVTMVPGKEINGSDTWIITVEIKLSRRVMRGDKFAACNAQKGTECELLRKLDLPYTREGICPTYITNSTCIASRMTIEYLIELWASKVGAYLQERIGGTAFSYIDINKYAKTLNARGKIVTGEEVLYSGLSSRKLPTPVMMGPCGIQVLRHMSGDKNQVRPSDGPVDPLTRQPKRGKSVGGGMRFGEMEGAAVRASGATMVLNDTLNLSSDPYPVAVCTGCGYFAIFNGNEYVCPKLKKKDQTDITMIILPNTTKVILQLLAGAGFNLRMDIVTSEKFIKMIESNTHTENIIESYKDMMGSALSELEREFNADVDEEELNEQNRIEEQQTDIEFREDI